MIDSTTQRESIRESIGYLFEPALIDEMFKEGRIVHVAADEIMVDTGDELPFVPVVLNGTLKISRDHENEELLLYYIEAGDTCTMTLQASTRARKSQIRATALEDATLLMIPQNRVEQWMDTYSTWRTYILESYHVRMQELMETIDAIAFMRLDERLEKFLIDQAKLTGSLEIHHTHQQIAEDLHSSRVVISRLLKQLELKGKIHLFRNRVVLKSI